MRRDSGYEFCYVSEEWELRGQVDEAGGVGGETGPEIDVAEGVGAARTNSAFVVVGEKFGFVGGDVDANGTVALASLAGETEIERLLDFFAAPSVANDAIFA